jgi:hypothetical protein
MNTKRISGICGVLYVLTVLVFPICSLLLKGQMVDAGNIFGTFSNLATNAIQYRLAIACDFLSVAAVMGLVFSLFAILKPVSAYPALLGLGLRIGEVVIQACAKVPDYLLLRLSQSTSSSGSSIVGIENLAQMLIAGADQALWLSFVFLAIGSLFNNYLFYKSKMIPYALATFGLISTATFTVGSVAALVINLPEFVRMGLMFPLVLFELILGFYLTMFGIKEKARRKQ